MSQFHGFALNCLTCLLDTGRGMMTRRPLNPGDVIISIPEKLLITPTYISHSYLGHALQR